MKKMIIICLSIISILIIAFFSLVYFRVILNPFIDNSDLICTREVVEDKEVYSFKFDWISNLKNTKFTNYIYFDDESMAEQYLLDIADDIGDETETSISENYAIITSKNVNHFEGNRKSIKKDLIDFGFECR